MAVRDDRDGTDAAGGGAQYDRSSPCQGSKTAPATAQAVTERDVPAAGACGLRGHMGGFD